MEAVCSMGMRFCNQFLRNCCLLENNIAGFRCSSTSPKISPSYSADGFPRDGAIVVGQNIDGQLSDNDVVNPVFINRNPRNLEKIYIAQKPKGYYLDTPTRNFWHKMFLEISSQHTTARVEHFTGTTVVSASTKEWAIQKHLYSTHDVCAAKSIGRVIAERCLESGILHVHVLKEDTSSDRVLAFNKALEEAGLSLEEPPRIYPTRPWH